MVFERLEECHNGCWGQAKADELPREYGGVWVSAAELATCAETPETTVLTRGDLRGYTLGMKTAVSIPDDVFEEAERLVTELQTSRSQLYSRALREFVARHAPDRHTEAMDRVVDEVGGEIDEFSQRASRRVLEQVEW